MNKDRASLLFIQVSVEHIDSGIIVLDERYAGIVLGISIPLLFSATTHVRYTFIGEIQNGRRGDDRATTRCAAAAVTIEPPLRNAVIIPKHLQG
jgi:hypothetical protein